MSLRAGYKGIKKYIADMLNGMSPGDGIATDKELASAVESAYQLVEDTVGWSGKNLAVPYTYNNTGSAAHGVTYVYDGTGKCTLNGTATAGDSRPTLSQVTAKRYFTIHAGSYKPIADSDDVTVQVYDVDTSTKLSDGEIFTVNADTNVLVRLYQTNGKVYNNLIVSYMLLRADIIDDTFEPYHASVEESKCDNSVIGTVENGATCEKSDGYSENDLFIRNGKIGIATTTIAQGAEFTLGTNYNETTIAALITALLNA